MRYILETTAFSAAMRRDESLFSFLSSHRPGEIVTVPPVVAEIYYGLERLDHSSKKYLLLKFEMDRLLTLIDTLPWTMDSSYYFGLIKSDLEKRGKLIDDFDIAIAAIAMAHKCCVITANIDHFQRIKKLKSRSWK